MSRFFVPGILIFAMSGLAFMLIGIIIARSPYTHANLSPEGYNRTEIALVGQERPFEGVGLADPNLAATGDAVRDGAALFFQYGCSSCHGLQGQGSAVGSELEDVTASELRRKVRQGPKGMPSFDVTTLSDQDVEKLHAFLESLRRKAIVEDDSEDVAATASSRQGQGGQD